MLADLRDTWKAGEAAVPTFTIIERLMDLAEPRGDWPSWWANLSVQSRTRRLGQALTDYGVKSKTIRFGSSTLKGYALEDLADTWDRYLSSNAADRPPGHGSETSGTSVTPQVSSVSDRASDPEQEPKQARGRGPGSWPCPSCGQPADTFFGPADPKVCRGCSEGER